MAGTFLVPNVLISHHMALCLIMAPFSSTESWLSQGLNTGSSSVAPPYQTTDYMTSDEQGDVENSKSANRSREKEGEFGAVQWGL